MAGNSLYRANDQWLGTRAVRLSVWQRTRTKHCSIGPQLPSRITHNLHLKPDTKNSPSLDFPLLSKQFCANAFLFLKKRTVSFGSSSVDMIATAGDFVYFDSYFGVPFIFCGIQLFVIFCGFICSSHVVLFSESYQCGQLLCIHFISRLFVTGA